MENTNPTLGEPLNIRQVAQLIGCSVWSIRQRHLPAGLPHFRSGRASKLIFYREQVIRWVLSCQTTKSAPVTRRRSL